jgi:hypothetical protein
VRTVLGLIAATCAALVVTAAAAAVPPRGLPDCLGHPQVRPHEVVFACADDGFGVDHLTWATWGGAQAIGLGSAYANDCKPTCVAGHVHRYQAVLIASGLQHCPNGASAYLTVTYAFIGRSPFPPGSSGTTSPRQTFRCGNHH